jgi:hypothetical protein
MRKLINPLIYKERKDTKRERERERERESLQWLNHLSLKLSPIVV